MTRATFTIIRYRRETHLCDRHFSDAVRLFGLMGTNYVMRGIPTNQPPCGMCASAGPVLVRVTAAETSEKGESGE